MKVHLKRLVKEAVALAMIPGSAIALVALNRFLILHTGRDLVTWSTVLVIGTGGTYGVGYFVEKVQEGRKRKKR